MKTLGLFVLTALLLAPVVGWADAPRGRFDASVPGTVLDTVTRLRWERGVSTTTETQPMASTRCDQLVLAGFSDWRLPSIKELASIVDERAVRPAFDPFFVSGPINSLLWSSTAHAGGAFWHLRDDGQILTASSAAPGYSRCVRTEP